MFKSGDWAEIRPLHEIAATLDDRGMLDGMPFMPEMAQHCGGRFRVFRRAHKTCDSISWTGLRRMDHMVHLTGLRCDGRSHGGCNASCMIFWHENWLRAVDGPSEKNAAQAQPDFDELPQCIAESTIARRDEHGNPVYCCQTTELFRASRPLPRSELRQYWEDFRFNGVAPLAIAKGVLISFWNSLGKKLGLPTYPKVQGKLKKTPTEDLGLESGDWVEVKSHEEILATVNADGRNRGLTFDVEMVPYCGKRFRVLKVVRKIIEEDSGKLVTLPGRCIILNNVICTAKYHRFCPRSTFPYWREIWLRRVEGPKGDEVTAAESPTEFEPSA